SVACLFGVAPDGGCRVSPPPDFHPAGLVSVALFVTSPCQGVTLHPALRSPDFPLHRATAAMQRLPGRLPVAILPRQAEPKRQRREVPYAPTALFHSPGRGQRQAHR